MPQHIDIESSHSREIVREVGARLRESLKQEKELPKSFKAQIERLRQVEDEAHRKG
jgi:hypothetical protein